MAVSNLDLVLLEARAAFDQLAPHIVATLEQLYKAVIAFEGEPAPAAGQEADGWETRWLAARPSACPTSCGAQAYWTTLFRNAELQGSWGGSCLVARLSQDSNAGIAAVWGAHHGCNSSRIDCPVPLSAGLVERK